MLDLAPAKRFPEQGSNNRADRAAGLERPIDSPFLKVGAAFRETLVKVTELPRAMGFQGKLCIHPEQVAVVNSVFDPGEDEAEQARRIVEAFAEAEAEGNASITVDGQFVDYPIAEKARRTLETFERNAAKL